LFRKPTKSGSSQISSRVWQLPVELQYVQSITDKNNAADLSSGAFTILLIDTWDEKNTKSIAVTQIS